MRYLGSKNRISKYIVPIIQGYINKDTKGYIEPFVGGANIIDKINCKHRYGSDIHENLICLLKQAQIDYTIFPPKITEDDYYTVRDNKQDYPNWYVGLVGFMSTFGNKYFRGIARNKTDGIQEYYTKSINNLIKQIPHITNVKFKCCEFQDINMNIKNYVIYCDPPYKNTTKYNTEEFPYEDFYDWCRKMSKNNTVLISEYDMPNDFECIWKKKIKISLDSKRKANDVKNNRIEKLFKAK